MQGIVMVFCSNSFKLKLLNPFSLLTPPPPPIHPLFLQLPKCSFLQPYPLRANMFFVFDGFLSNLGVLGSFHFPYPVTWLLQILDLSKHLCWCLARPSCGHLQSEHGNYFPVYFHILQILYYSTATRGILVEDKPFPHFPVLGIFSDAPSSSGSSILYYDFRVLCVYAIS